MYIVCHEVEGQVLFLKSFITLEWTEFICYAIGFKKERLAEKILSLVCNELEAEENELDLYLSRKH